MLLQRQIKHLTKQTLVKSGFFRITGRLFNTCVVILRYHSIQHEPILYLNSIGNIIHKADIFERQMELLAHKYHPSTLDDVLLFVTGQKSIPKRSVVVTFDDGFADNFEIAAPILDRYGIIGAFYITVDTIEASHPPWFCRLRHAFANTRVKKWLDSTTHIVYLLVGNEERNSAFLASCARCASLAGDSQNRAIKAIENELEIEFLNTNGNLMMNWAQIRALHRTGHTIGSHSLTHPNLAHVGTIDLNKEIGNSKSRLENELKSPIVHFSYPSPILNPHWSTESIEATRATGYLTAVTCSSGRVCTGDDPFALKRIWAPMQTDELLWNLENSFMGRLV